MGNCTASSAVFPDVTAIGVRRLCRSRCAVGIFLGQNFPAEGGHCPIIIVFYISCFYFSSVFSCRRRENAICFFRRKQNTESIRVIRGFAAFL